MAAPVGMSWRQQGRLSCFEEEEDQTTKVVFKLTQQVKMFKK